MDSNEGNAGNRDLVVNVRLRDVRKDDQPPEVVVYAFTSHGQLISQQPVQGDGAVRLPLPDDRDPGMVRVFVGPPVDGEPTLSELRRLGAVERDFRPFREEPNLDFEIWRPDWFKWRLSVCCVHGHVFKRFAGLDLPVCDATVEVFEVDPFWIIIQRLPDSVIEALRDLANRVAVEIDPRPFRDFGDLVPNPIPQDPPPPGPFPRPPRPLPDPVGPFMRGGVLGRLSEFLPNPDDPNEPHGPGSPVIRALTDVMKSLPPRALVSARSGSLPQFRQELLLHAELLRPIFCWIHHRWVIRQKIAQGTTNCEGKFNICFFQSVFNTDKPDLWFRVTQNIPGIGPVTIYERFPVACHTWWNYDCSSEVNLYTTHPLAYTCSCDPNVDNPGNWVLLDAIGATFAAQIRGMSLALEATTTTANRGLTDDGRPFAGRLDPILYFSPGLTAAGVKYRISYQKETEPPTVWHALTDPVSRSYLFDTGGIPEWGTHPLGPTGELYDCRPANPPQGTWEVRYFREDRAATFFDTTTLLGLAEFGLFRLKVEVFRNDGTPLPLGDPALGFQFLVGTGVPGLQDPAWAALLQGDALVVPVFIDKRMCVASIGAPSLSGASADPNCGGLTFMGTGGTVSMPYTATQPGGFFTFSWDIVRGAGNPVPGLTHSPGLVTATVANMIGTCVDGAAFSIDLHVFGTAQDGYSRLGSFDANDHVAFMLIKA